MERKRSERVMARTGTRVKMPRNRKQRDGQENKIPNEVIQKDAAGDSDVASSRPFKRNTRRKPGPRKSPVESPLAVEAEPVVVGKLLETSPGAMRTRANTQETTPVYQHMMSPAVQLEKIKRDDLPLSPPSSRYFQKQLETSLSPKMTAIVFDAERRVSRFGRHLKQKLDNDYVPIEVAKYVTKTISKAKPKTPAMPAKSGQEPECFDTSAMSDSAAGSSGGNASLVDVVSAASVSDSVSPAKSTMGIVSPAISNVSLSALPIVVGELVSIEHINFIDLDDSFVLEEIVSEADSAKGSSIGTNDDGYRPGDIYWGQFGNKKQLHWPCLVRQDPESGQIVKSLEQGKRTVNVYFFADNGRRSFIRENSLFEYKGTEEYQMRVENGDFGKSLKSRLKKALKMQSRWSEAVGQANEFMAIAVEHRVARFDEQVAIERVRLSQTRKRKSVPGGMPLPFKVKRERSLTPDSPAYEELPKRIKLENEYNNNITRYFASMKMGKEGGAAVADDLVSSGSERSASVEPHKTAMVRQPKARIKKEPLSLEQHFIFNLDRAYLTKGLPKGDVCTICKYPEKLEKCAECYQQFHLTCLANDEAEHKRLQTMIERKSFKCSDCAAGVAATCFVCNSHDSDAGSDLLCCSWKDCKRNYHLPCLKLFPQFRFGLDSNSLVCPYHTCHTCLSDNPKENISTARSVLAKCIECPSAYHAVASCIPAGSQILTAQRIVCPKHSLQAINLNTNWCFLCCKGGKLVCCETCPSSFHDYCLQGVTLDDRYICEECESGRMPLYNEVVLAKLGNFRWWPALVMPPPAIPERLDNQSHHPNDLCVKFFKTHDMAWLNRKRVYLYNPDDSNNLGPAKSGTLDRNYRKAMAEARIIYDILQQRKQPMQQKLLPPPFVRIKVNRYVPPLSRQMANISETVCSCQPDDDDPCGPASDCLNRAVMIECSVKTCPAGNRCGNQSFTKRNYPSLQVQRFSDKGWGLISNEAIERDQFIIEYVGEVINAVEFESRMQYLQEQKQQHFYFLTLEGDMKLDAGSKGNLARFINHSCEPNCETRKWIVDGAPAIGLFALRPIPPGDELTFNYQLQSTGDRKQHCFCGAAKCSGLIGEKYRAKETERRSPVKRVAEKAKRKSQPRKSMATVDRRKDHESTTTITAGKTDGNPTDPVLDRKKRTALPKTRKRISRLASVIGRNDEVIVLEKVPPVLDLTID